MAVDEVGGDPGGGGEAGDADRPGAGAGLPDHVGAVQGEGNRHGLDGERMGDAHRVERVDDVGGDP